MAKNMVGNKIKMSYAVGVDAEGKDVYLEQTISDIADGATPEQLLDLADKVSDIIGFSIVTVKKVEEYILTRY